MSDPSFDPSTRAAPIDHVVLIVKEGHTFDNYFGRFPGVDGDGSLRTAEDTRRAPLRDSHWAWIRRKFLAVHEQYAESQIPGYWNWARNYALCDRYFSEVAGPSTPNQLMLIGAASPVIDDFKGDRAAKSAIVDFESSLPRSLTAAGLEWRNYNGYAFDLVRSLRGRTLRPERFAVDARRGDLPAVSWLFADYTLSEHPPRTRQELVAGCGDVWAGMTWTMQQVQAVVEGGLWPRSAIFVLWDSWGGWYDHVTPPELESWHDGTRFRLGSRVGCLALGPYAKAGHVFHAFSSHLSLIKFCEDLFRLPPVNDRTRRGTTMLDCFDFGQAPRPAPRQTTWLPPARPRGYAQAS